MKLEVRDIRPEFHALPQLFLGDRELARPAVSSERRHRLDLGPGSRCSS